MISIDLLKKNTIILVGDCIINKDYEDDECLLKYFQSANICIGNFESLIHNFEYFPEKYDNQGSPMQSSPAVTEILKRYNLNMLGHANNHSNDYGPCGLLSSLGYLKTAGIRVAGIGENEAEAFKPCNKEVNGFTIGFISSTTSYPDWAIATPGNLQVKGKPGVNYIALSPNFLLYISKACRTVLKKIKLHRIINLFYFGGYHIGKSEFFKIEKQIHEIKASSDLVIYSLHSHQGISYKPPRALRRIAHYCINSGVDVFFSHGSHELRGIEIYKGKPIFMDWKFLHNRTKYKHIRQIFFFLKV